MHLTLRWTLDWSQRVMVLSASIACMAAGIIASTRIGGGSNLHNLDMFFITLVILLLTAFREQISVGKLPIQGWPYPIRALLIVGVLLPAWMSFAQGDPLKLPPASLTEEYLDDIQEKVDSAKVKGEILFIDQRQLLTFGLVKHVNLVSD